MTRTCQGVRPSVQGHAAPVGPALPPPGLGAGVRLVSLAPSVSQPRPGCSKAFGRRGPWGRQQVHVVPRTRLLVRKSLWKGRGMTSSQSSCRVTDTGPLAAPRKPPSPHEARGVSLRLSQGPERRRPRPWPSRPCVPCLDGREDTHLQDVGGQFKHHLAVHVDQLLRGKPTQEVSLVFLPRQCRGVPLKQGPGSPL